MSTPDPAWFVATVKPQREAAVANGLEVRGIQQFSPSFEVQRQWSDRRKTLRQALFPGYVFCRFAREERSAVLKTPGVTSIVGFGGVPASVDDQEVARVRAMIASGLPLQPWPFLEQGHAVHIEHGPLRGVDGIVVELKDACHLVVSIQLLQRSVSVAIDRGLVTPLASVNALGQGGAGAFACGN